MTITLVGTAGNSGNSNAPTVTHGQTILADDVILALICYDEDSANTCAGDNGGDAMSEDLDAALGIASFRLALYSRVAPDASEPSSYDFALGDSVNWGAMVRIYRGVDPSVYDVAPSLTNEGTGPSPDHPSAPSITTLTNGAMAIMAAFFDSGGTSDYYASPSNGFGNERESGGGRACVTYDKLIASAGAVGATGCTQDWGGQSWSAFQFALKPSGGGPPAGAGRILTLNRKLW